MPQCWCPCCVVGWTARTLQVGILWIVSSMNKVDAFSHFSQFLWTGASASISSWDSVVSVWIDFHHIFVTSYLTLSSCPVIQPFWLPLAKNRHQGMEAIPWSRQSRQDIYWCMDEWYLVEWLVHKGTQRETRSGLPASIYLESPEHKERNKKKLSSVTIKVSSEH